MRYLRLWLRFVQTAAIREAEYRLNLAIGILERLGQIAVAVISILLIYRFTARVAGWTAAEVLMLVGIYRVMEGLINLLVAPNMMAVSGYIRRGDLDFLLLRPVSSQFLISLRLLSLPELANILVGLGLIIYGARVTAIAPSPADLAASLLFGLSGLILLYALWFGIVTLTFWLVSVDTLDTLFYSLFEAGRYPVSFFKGAIRALLTFVIPVAFATTFPTQALLGIIQPAFLLWGLLLAALALLLTHAFWQYALRHYSSASS